MKLLEYIDYQIKVSAEALLIKPIRQLYNSDRYLSKEKFMQQISYLYFMVDPRSTYSYIINEEERAKAIIEQEGLPHDFKPDTRLEEAMEIYKKHTVTESSLLLEDCRVAIDEVRSFLRGFKLDSESNMDDKGRPIYKINDLLTAVSKIPELVKKLSEAEKAVNRDIEEQGRARGNQGSKTLMEDGIFV